MSEWRDAVRRELERFRARTGRDVVSREELLAQSLSRLDSRFPDAETPEQTASRVLQELRDRDEVAFLGDGEYRILDVSPFEMGETYKRTDLHNRFGGIRQSGIAPCADYPYVFIFTGDVGDQHGYVDEFREDGAFRYTGEGQVGDMEFERGNRAIRDHRDEGRDLHLFENDENGYVTYVGRYEYRDHTWRELRDTLGDKRDAIVFELAPADDNEVIVTSEDEADIQRLYEKAKVGSSTPGSSSSGGLRYSRSELVKEVARRLADGVCQGCGDPAPFRDENGKPFLEVHHLHRRSDGGLDDPDNVIALCPNCHRRVHYGANGEEFNERLKEQVTERDFLDL